MNRDAAKAVLTAARPQIPGERVAEFLATAYGLTGRLSEVEGERDQNFRFDTETSSWSVKVANRAERPEVLAMQQAALEHLAKMPSPVAFPSALRSVDGHAVVVLSHDGNDHQIRVQSWLDGPSMRSDAASTPIAATEIGILVAEVQRALRGFFHPAAGRPILWDLRHAGDLGEFVDQVRDDATRRLVEKSLAAHLEVLAGHESWSAQVVHNDLNPDNVVSEGGHVIGVFDFGDMIHGPRVVDLAVAASYQLGDQPSEAIERVAAAFERRSQLDRSERAALPSLVALRLCQSIVISSWRRRLDPENSSYLSTDIDLAATSLAKLDRGSDIGSVDLARRRETVLAPGLRLSYRRPLEIASAHGIHVTDTAGRVYLDAYNNVAQVGHGNDEIAAVTQAQAQRLNTNTRHLTEAVVECAERLVALLPEGLDTCYFTTSGSEANDLAIRMARTVTGNHGVMITPNAYHGSTDLTFALSPEEHKGRRLAGWVATTTPPSTGDPDGNPDGSVAALRSRGFGLAAGIVDTVFSSDGIHDVSAGYLERFARACSEAGGLYVADEVQAGLGRVGRRFWGFAAAEVKPDIVTIGKPLGNGYPIGAVVTRREIAERFAERDYYFSTFGGSSSAAVVASAVMRLTLEMDLARNADVVGAQLLRFLAQQSDTVPWLGEPRGAGMFIGVPVGDSDGVAATDRAEGMVNLLRDHGVLIGRTGPGLTVLKIRPPLVFGERDASDFDARFTAALEDA